MSLIKSWIAIEYLSSSNEIDINDNNLYLFTEEVYTRFKTAEFTNYNIKIGTFETGSIYGLLAELFSDADFLENSSNKISYICELELDVSGALNPETIAISSFPWAVQQLQSKSKTSKWKSNFQKFKNAMIEEIIQIFKMDQSLFEKIAAVEIAILHVLGWQLYSRNKNYFSPLKRHQEAEDKVLNSFYTADLSMLNSLPSNNYGKAFKSYIQQPTNLKVDLLHQPQFVRKKLSAQFIPEGSWPSAFSLSLMQQFAVNHIVNDLANTSGSFSVNGPPGTGKTTLLKDVFAAILVKRAKILTSYNNPTDAFTYAKSYPITENFKVHYYQPKDNICDDAIIVASSNNAAVENISKELPKIDNDYFKKYEDNPEKSYPENIYFKDIGQLLYGDAVWNCFSFALGNMSNRSAFINIWEKWNQETRSFDKPFQLTIDNLKYTLADWQRVRKEFSHQLAEFSALKKALEAFEHFLSKKEFIALLKQYKNDPEFAIVALKESLKNNHQEIERNQLKKNELGNKFEREKYIKPMFWHFWFNTKAAKRYFTKLALLNTQIDACENAIESLEEQNTKIELQLKDVAYYKMLKSDYKNTIPDELFWISAFEETPSKSQELSPWFTDNLKEQSVKLFYTSLELHTIFISLSAKEIKSNISILVNHFKNKLQVGGEALKGIWNTLFLLTPVISTTFASVGNLFRGLEAESFGWLFIDEAGQAIPQAAAGAIYRAKRVVAVGDPMQIEPVVTLPEKIFEYIRNENNVAVDIMNTSVSVQTFMDRINPLGAFIGNNLWVGSPLNVHRRCAEPMFRIANQIAYNNIMQNGIKNNSIPQIGTLYSRCDEISGTCTIKQFIPDQGLHAIRLITEYYNSLEHKNNFNLFVISPFKAVIGEFRKQVKIGLPNEITSKMVGKMGTVHTFQGKEADVVLFLSGCDQTKSGAVRWADASPNLLNVALTRAKKVFIFIGQKEFFFNTKYFSQMIRELEINKEICK